MAQNFSLICLLLAISHVALGVEWTDLRTHYNTNALNGFFKMPRTEVDAWAENWVKINSECLSAGDGNTFAGFRYENPEDDGVVLLYDVNGFIAGIQSRMSQLYMLPETPVNPFRFDLVPMFQNITENGHTYFVLTAYFVDPEIICTTGRTELEFETEGTGTGIHFQNGPTPQDLKSIPKSRADAINEGWSKNSCFPGMGLHNFYEVEQYESHSCTESQPTFALYNKAEEELLGFGFTVTGTDMRSKYFEHPPNAAISIILGEPVPECVIPTNDLMGTTTLHVYFTPQPWLLTC